MGSARTVAPAGKVCTGGKSDVRAAAGSIVHRIAEDVEGENDEDDGYAREDDHEGPLFHIFSRTAKHRAPTGIRRLNAKPKEAECRFEEDGEAKTQGKMNHERWKDVGQNVVSDDPQRAAANRLRSRDVRAFARDKR